MWIKPDRRPAGEPRFRGPVVVRFYEELNDFLPEEKRKRPFEAAFQDGDTVKALIESLGVPHTEVDLVLVNGESAAFEHRLNPGDRISVYPMFESFDIGELSRVRPVPLREVRFVADVHLGRLAAALRMLGFDTLYSNSRDDDSLAAISASQHRILLTRDRGLLKRRSVTHGYLVRSRAPAEQLPEVIRRFDLGSAIRPFTRCLRCNLILEDLPVEEVRGRVPPRILGLYRRFRRCPSCGRVFWPGTHWEAMRKKIGRIPGGPVAGGGAADDAARPEAGPPDQS